MQKNRLSLLLQLNLKSFVSDGTESFVCSKRSETTMSKLRSPVKCFQPMENSQKHILRHIICCVMIQQHLKHRASDGSQMTAQKCLQQIGLARSAESLDQVFIRFRQTSLAAKTA